MFNNLNLTYKNKKYLIGILVFLISFAVYLKTLSPTISFEDSGEFVTDSYTLACGHPPGYQLYIIIGKLFTFIPISSIAFRVIALSAYCGAATCLIVYFIILLLLENSKARTSVLAAATASLIFAFSSVQWDLSIIDEVYTMSMFFTTLQIFMLLKWAKSLNEPYNNIYEKYSLKRMGYLYTFSMLYGLAFGVHHTATLFVISFLYFIFVNDHKLLLDPTKVENALVTLKNSAILLFMWVLGFLVYFYLPIRSTRNPVVDWGDPDSLQNFLDVFLRRQYGGVPGLISTLPDFLKKIAFFDMVQQFTPLMIIPVLLGVWRLYKLNTKNFVFISSIFVSYTIGFLLITDPPIPYELPLLLKTFYIPVYMVLAIWMGIGFTYIMDIIAQVCYQTDINGNVSASPIKKICAITLITIILLLPLLPYNNGLEEHNNVKHYFAYDYGMNMLRSVQRNGVIFTFLAQDTFPLWYLTKVEGRRKDVVVVHQRLLSLPWHSKQEKNNNPDFNVEYPELTGHDSYNLFKIADVATRIVIAKNPNRPMYFSNFRSNNESRSFPLKETGLIAQVTTESSPPRIVGREVFHYYVYREMFRDGGVSKDNRVREISSIYAYQHQFEAAVYIDYHKFIFRAISLLKQASYIEPQNPYVYRNLAQSYKMLGMKNIAIQFLEKSLQLDNQGPDAEVTKSLLKELKDG